MSEANADGDEQEDVLAEARRVIDNRADQREDSFPEIATMWSAYFGIDVSEADVANCMMLLKIARNANGVYERDNYVDLAGYAYWGAEKDENA